MFSLTQGVTEHHGFLRAAATNQKETRVLRSVQEWKGIWSGGKKELGGIVVQKEIARTGV